MIDNLPLRHKITAIAVTTTAVVLVLASAIFIGLEVNSYRRELTFDLTTAAKVAGAGSAAAMRAGDRNAAARHLAILEDRPLVTSASLVSAQGEVFALYGEPVDSAGERHSKQSGMTVWRERGANYEMFWSPGVVELHAPIIDKGDTLGAIHVRANLTALYATLRSYVGVILLTIACAVSLAWILAVRLQRQVTRPILELLATMRTVADQRDYSIRVSATGRNELGTLIDGFNAMLAKTQEYQSELKAARRHAEAENRFKSEFLAHVSHELRTPLNAILGFSDFMMTEPLGPLGHGKYREYAEDIHGGGRHLLDVINDILDLSKIEAGAADLREEVFDAEALIHESGRLLRERALKGRVDLRMNVAAGLPYLYGDSQLIKRGLLNLISNAVKFTPTEGHVIVRAFAEPGGDFVIAVSDTGIGIETEQLAHVMTPFGQAENVLTRTHDGTGLGLPLVKSFVELHGGSLDLQSVAGFGTEVTMRLPGWRVRLRPVPGAGGEDTAPEANAAAVRVNGDGGGAPARRRRAAAAISA